MNYCLKTYLVINALGVISLIKTIFTSKGIFEAPYKQYHSSMISSLGYAQFIPQ